MTAYPIKPSEPSARVESTAIVSVECFFNDVADLPYEPLPEHSLEQSPCYPIIGRDNNRVIFLQALHPEVKNVNLESVEHHCKYKDPDYHKSEILKLLSTKSPDNELALIKCNEVERLLPSPIHSFDIQVKSRLSQQYVWLALLFSQEYSDLIWIKSISRSKQNSKVEEEHNAKEALDKQLA